MSHTRAIQDAQDALQRIREAAPRDPVLDTDFDLVEAALRYAIDARAWFDAPAPRLDAPTRKTP